MGAKYRSRKASRADDGNRPGPRIVLTFCCICTIVRAVTMHNHGGGLMEHSSARSRASWIDRLPRRVRRVIVVITLIGLPGMYAWSAFWLSTSAPKLLWGPVSFLLIGATLAGALVLYMFVRDRAGDSSKLDERQRQLRDQAMVLCYQVLSAVVIVAVLWLGITVLGLGRVVALDATIVGGMAVVVGVLVPLLPVAALAW